MPKPLLSPVTGSKNVEKKLSIPVEKVIDSYKAVDLASAAKYLNHVETIDIYECTDTGYRFYYPFTVFGDDKFYEYLQNKRPSYSHLRWEHNPALDLITNEKKVLEIGSGSGEFLERASSLANEARGLEFNKKAIDSSKKRGLNVTGESIEEHAKTKTDYYDLVCMFQVLEHIWDVRPFLSAAVKTLKKDGRLVIGVPNNNPYLYKHDVLHALNLPPHHSGLWNKASLRALGDHFGLELERQLVEPLDEIEYFWNVQREHWRQTSKLLYLLSTPLNGRRLYRIRNILIKNLYEGRNVLVIFRKV